MKHLIIRHFGPIEEVDINFKRINLIIGPQSSGKSTVLKIACFCDWMEKQIELNQNPNKFCNAAFFVQNLVGFHKLEGYMQPDSYISYENDAVYFDYSENLIIQKRLKSVLLNGTILNVGNIKEQRLHIFHLRGIL